MTTRIVPIITLTFTALLHTVQDTNLTVGAVGFISLSVAVIQKAECRDGLKRGGWHGEKNMKRKQRHHNRHAKQQIKSGNVKRSVIRIARRLKIPYKRPRRDEKNE